MKMDLKIVTIVALVGVTLSCVSASGDKNKPADWTSYEGKNWGVKVKPYVYVNPNVRYGRLDGQVRYDINNRLSVTGSGWRDTTRNWGAGVGIRYRWKREAGHMINGVYHLRIDASPCQFLVYDVNMDGTITLNEVEAVFPDTDLAEKLFRDLDSTTGDGMVTEDEFSYMAPKIIYGCVSGPESVQDDSVTAE